jgi:hypothetical protein
VGGDVHEWAYAAAVSAQGGVSPFGVGVGEGGDVVDCVVP